MDIVGPMTTAMETLFALEVLFALAEQNVAFLTIQGSACRMVAAGQMKIADMRKIHL